MFMGNDDEDDDYQQEGKGCVEGVYPCGTSK